MAPVATVLIPTHDHGPLVRFSIESALAQTAADLEVFVVGDGVPDVTRDIVAELARNDPRVRFFDNTKGPRHGEVHRHAALAEASGEVVLYLADDDVLFPEHVETMAAALHDLELCSAVCLKAYPDGSFAVRMHDIGHDREAFLAGGRGIPLSCAAHTMAAYRALPHGWRTTPPSIATDKYMWQQFVADAECRVGSATRLTVVSLGSTYRRSMSIEERLTEMEGWWECVRDPVRRGELHAEACALAIEGYDRLLQKRRRDRAKLEVTRAKLAGERERRWRRRVRSLTNRVRRS